MDPAGRPLGSWGVWAAMGVVVVGAVVGALILVRVSAIHPVTTRFGFPGFQLPIAVIFGTAGAVILRRRPGNVIGALLLAEGVLSTLQFPVEWLPRVLEVSGGSGEAIGWAAVLANVAWIPAVATFGLLFALYPDGRPAGPRWARLVPAIVGGAVIAAIGLTLTPGAFFNYPAVINPLGLPALSQPGLATVWYALMLAPLAMAGVSLLARWRGSTGDARAQLKWLAFVGVPFAIAGFVATVYPVGSLAMIGLGALIPVAIAIAILRYRLYDIDELVSRTFIFGALTAILAGLYTAAVKFFNELFLQVTGTESEGAIILATLVLAAAFTPLRKWLEGLVERRLQMKAHAAAAAGTANTSPGSTFDPALLEAIVRRAVRDELARYAADQAGQRAVGPEHEPVMATSGPVEEPAQA